MPDARYLFRKNGLVLRWTATSPEKGIRVLAPPLQNAILK
jgi:hypothetical protein